MVLQSELAQQDARSLRQKVLELKRELMNLRLQHRSKELKNMSQIRRVRRDVARVKTALGGRVQKKEGQ
jgi:large subunit ribosomal protein L29